METKKLSEMAKLKLMNCNLSLQLLQIQANQIIAERDRILLEELKRLKCNPNEWQLDEKTFDLIKKM